jgi:hypothetical protein
MKTTQDPTAKTRWHLTQPQTNKLIAVFVGVAVLLSSYLVLQSVAGGFFVVNEPETGAVDSPAKIVNDVGAAGGKAIQFTAPPSTPPPPPPPPPPTSSCSFTVLPANDCNPWLPSPASGKSWKLSFTEEFNGSDYDHSKLTPCFDWNYGACTKTFNQGREAYLPEQVTVSGGIAKLTAEPLNPPLSNSACYQGQCTYKAGLLSTARPRADTGADYLYKFTYGYVESRLKFPATRGFFTAFWMLPANTSFEYRSEIDILEQLGYDPTTMYMTYHYNNRASSHNVNSGAGKNGTCATKDYSTDFHRIGLDWQPTYVAWYIDGVKCGQYNGNSSTIENGPMQIILHMMIDNNWTRSWNQALTDTTLKRSLEVDYIRVFQQQ